MLRALGHIQWESLTDKIKLRFILCAYHIHLSAPTNAEIYNYEIN